MADFDVNIILKARDEATKVVRGLVGETKRLRSGPMGGRRGGAGGMFGENIMGSGRTQMGAFDFDAHRVAARLAGASANISRLTNQIKGAISAPLELSANFEQAMAEVRAVTTDAQIGSNFESLSEVARQLGRDTEFTAEEVAGGLKFMGVAGLDTAQQLATISPLLDAATVSGLDLARTSDLVTDVMGGFGMGADEARKAVDSMIATTLNANTNLDQLSRGMFKVAPLAKKVGIEFNEVSALLGTMASAGIKGAEGGTALRNIMLSLTGKPSKDMRDLLKHLGLNSKKLREDLGKKGIAGTMQTLMEQMQHLDEPMQLFAANVLFGRRTAVSATNVLDKLGTEYQELREKVDDSAGASAKAAAEFRDTAKTAGKTLKSALSDLGIEIGDQLMPLMLPLIRDAKVVAKEFGEWAKKNPALVQSLGKIAITAVALGSVLGPLLLTLSSVVSVVTFGRTAMLLFGGASTAAGAGAGQAAVGFKMLGAAAKFALGPVGALLAVIAATWVIIDVTQNKIEKLKDQSVDMAKQNAKAAESAVTKAESEEQLEQFIGSRQKTIRNLERDMEKNPRGVVDSLFGRGRDERAEIIEQEYNSIRAAKAELMRRRDKAETAAAEEQEKSKESKKTARGTAEADRRIAEGDARIDAGGKLEIEVTDKRVNVRTVEQRDIPIDVRSGVPVGGL